MYYYMWLSGPPPPVVLCEHKTTQVYFSKNQFVLNLFQIPRYQTNTCINASWKGCGIMVWQLNFLSHIAAS